MSQGRLEYDGTAWSKYCCHEHAVDAYWDSHRETLNAKRRERYKQQKGVD